MAYNLKEQMSKPERFVGRSPSLRRLRRGHRLPRHDRAPWSQEDKAVICNATGCLEVSSFLYPFTAWEDSYIHAAFENASATWPPAWRAAYQVTEEEGQNRGHLQVPGHWRRRRHL